MASITASRSIKWAAQAADTDSSMWRGDPLGRSTNAVIVPLSFALLVVVTVLRLAVSNPIEAVGFLYVIPISLLASERGWRGGLYGATAALGLTIVWAVVQHVPLGVIGYCSRAATFASRRVEKVVAYPPLSEMGEQQRREFHEALLDADGFEDLPGKWQAAILKAEESRPHLRIVSGD